MSRWEENVRKTVPYVPGEQPKMSKLIKLNTNENPYPPSSKVAQALAGLDQGLLRRYPDSNCTVLVEAIAGRYGVEPENVFVGVGSDDVLAMSFLTFFNSDKPILFPDITYSFYDVWANVFRIPFETPALDDAFKIDPEDYKKENGGVVIANPNAPTGEFLPLEKIEEIIRANPDVVVIVDEAYIDFGGESALPLIQKYENLLVVQTFSKSRSLAGMRIGYCFGSKKIIGYLNDVKQSFNSYTMNSAALAAGTAAVEDEEYFQKTRKQIIATRERTKKELKALGFTFADSQTNFIFAAHESCPARELFAALRKESIIVRYFDKPRIDNFLRITIGTDEEMDVLVTFLKKYLAERTHNS